MSDAEMLTQLLISWPRQVVSDVLFSFAEPAEALASGEVAARLQIDFAIRRRKKSAQGTLQSATSPDTCLCILDKDYPDVLKHIPDPPLVLYFRGDKTALNASAVAIVGARRATRVGQDLARRIGTQLTKAGLVVVSGLAHGIDAAAHLGVLDVSGKTISVLGGGLAEIYPKDHSRLADRIVDQGGVLVSEYAPLHPPLAHQFPERNRIISGLSQGVLVVEAGLRSGSLITARLALEQGRDVFVVPGPVNSLVSQGCHRLIRQGAELVTDAEQILASLGWQALEPSNTVSAPILNQDQQYLLALLAGYHQTTDELMSLTGWSVEKVTVVLAEMELEGIVRAGPQGYIAAS